MEAKLEKNRGKRRKRENKDDKKKWNEMRRIKIEEQRDKLKERKKKNGKKEGSGIDWARVLFQWRSAMFLR